MIYKYLHVTIQNPLKGNDFLYKTETFVHRLQFTAILTMEEKNSFAFLPAVSYNRIIRLKRKCEKVFSNGHNSSVIIAKF